MRWYTFSMEGGRDGHGIACGYLWRVLAKNLNIAFTIAQRDMSNYGYRCNVLRFVKRS